MIIDLKILAADFMFPSSLRPEFQTSKLRAFYCRENVNWTMFSRFATPPPKKEFFMCSHTGHGEQCSFNVQCKCPVVLSGLKCDPFEHGESVSLQCARSTLPSRHI